MTTSTTATTTAVSYVRFVFKFAHDWLEGTMEGVDQIIAHYAPAGKANPLGSEYAHVTLAEDAIVNGVLKGSAPLMMSSHAGKTGISEPPPPAEWGDWARRVQIDVAAARRYAQAVHEATDAYLAQLTDEDLERPVDMSAFGFGTVTAGFALNLLILNNYCHAGEISCLKGLQGLKGYPA